MRLRTVCRFLWLAGALLIAVAACAPGASQQPPIALSQTPNPTSLPALPTLLPAHTPRSAEATPAQPTLPALPPATAAEAAVRYRIEAELDWPSRSLQVSENVNLRNDSGVPLRTVFFTIDCGGDASAGSAAAEPFILTRVTTGAGLEVENYTLDATRLAVALPQPLAPGALLSIQLDFALSVPPIANGYRLGHFGYLGYSDRQVNLGSWFPLLAQYDLARGWLTPALHPVGEQAVRRLADFDVTLKVRRAPDGLRAAAPGSATTGAAEWRFVLKNARELTISLSDHYEILSAQTASGVAVDLYTFAEPGRDLAAAHHALQTATNALALFERLYNQPYPYERLVVVEGDFPDGMEFSGLVFVSRDWFRAWQGVANDWLTVITAHEIAHQWWYCVVGSDQGSNPYLDEALAIYSELLYVERYLPEHTAWWWDFRVNAYEPAGYVDTPVYEFHSPRAYINAVYLQGARMMQTLRDDLGDLAFFGWLQRYAAQMRGQVAAPDDFWGALTGEEYAATLEVRRAFLRNVNVLARSADLP